VLCDDDSLTHGEALPPEVPRNIASWRLAGLGETHGSDAGLQLAADHAATPTRYLM